MDRSNRNDVIDRRRNSIITIERLCKENFSGSFNDMTLPGLRELFYTDLCEFSVYKTFFQYTFLIAIKSTSSLGIGITVNSDKESIFSFAFRSCKVTSNYITADHLLNGAGLD